MHPFVKLLMLVLVCSIPYKASTQERDLILFERDSMVWAELRLQGEEDEAIIRFYKNGGELKKLAVKIVKGRDKTIIGVREARSCKTGMCLHLAPKQEGSVVRVPILRSPEEIAGTTARLFVVETMRGETGTEHLTISEGTSVDVTDALISSTPRTQFIEFMEDDMQRQAIRYRANKDVPSVSVACAEDYADRITKPYECMRSLIPGVQQLHNVLTYLRDNAPWVPAEATTSPYVRISDDFSEGRTHGEYVSLAFESVSANKRNTCNLFSGQFNGTSYCYLKNPPVEQVNLSRGGLDFARRGSVVPHISKEQFLSEQIRAGVATGNTGSLFLADTTPPVLGPHQNGLGDVMDTGYLTLVGGWNNNWTVNFADSSYPGRVGLTGITQRQIFDLTNRMSYGSRSCEKDGGVPATKERCVLFPQSFFYFEEDGDRRQLRGTSGAVALYNGVFDLLRTIYHPVMTPSETDAVIRSCAIDINPDGFEEVVADFPEYRTLISELLEDEEAVERVLSFYGEEGVDSVTGVGRGDLSCLFEEDGSLIADPRRLISSSLP